MFPEGKVGAGEGEGVCTEANYTKFIGSYYLVWLIKILLSDTHVLKCDLIKSFLFSQLNCLY